MLKVCNSSRTPVQELFLSSTTTYLLLTFCFVIPTIDSRISTLTYYLFTSLYTVVKELEALQGNLSGKSSNGSRAPILGLEHIWLIKKIGAVVGLTGLEPVTLRLSSACSNQLSYRPIVVSFKITFSSYL